MVWLVAKGFKKVCGIDYDETFLSVVMLKFVPILLANVAYDDYKIWKMDVKTTFLNENLLEDVYMAQLKGFVDPKEALKVYKLQRSIYRLKQVSRSWNLHFDETKK